MSQWTVKQLESTAWFRPLLELIQQQLDRRSEGQQDRRPALEREYEQLRQQIQGWSLSLADPGLSSPVRGLLQQDLDGAMSRQQEIAGDLAEAEAQRRQVRAVVDAQQVVDRLNRLGEVLAGQNASRTNLELSLHIDAIRCYQDGRAVVRTCKLGALTGGSDLLTDPEGVAPQQIVAEGEAMKAKPRRRAVRQVSADNGSQAELLAAAHQAADVDRFAGLGPEWFWEDTFTQPRKLSWAEENAGEVARCRGAGMTHEQLTEHFGRSVPTIRKALRLAAESDEAVRALPRKMPRPCWAKDHSAEVARLKAQGLSMTQIAQQVGKSEPTVRAALEHAERLADLAGDPTPMEKEEGQASPGETTSTGPVASPSALGPSGSQ
jgi:predicted transcriptional regulator